MLDHGMRHVPLGRTFHELPAQAPADIPSDTWTAPVSGTTWPWAELLKLPRVVILAEAGAGKTAEIHGMASALRAEGKQAFFLRLEHVADDFEGAFEVGDYADFEAWHSSTGNAWLLLDSVDEARLRSPADFETAIRRLGQRLTTAKDRAYLVITGRTSAWRPKTDLALCERHLPLTPARRVANNRAPLEHAEPADRHLLTTAQAPPPPSPFRIFSLDGLSRDQVETFCRARGIAHIQAFLDAVERADAWSFTSRPQDLEELTAFWQDAGRIGGRLDIMRNSVARRLTERDQNRAEMFPLSAERARAGARLIAAACTLVREPTIQVPDGAREAKGLSLRALLPEWGDREIAALLSRPIFDDAIYGTVRFHHRSVREFLAAEWLSELTKRNPSRRLVRQLLFRDQYGMRVAVPGLRDVLPWLVLSDAQLRETVRAVAPEVLFEGGDPGALPLDTRQAVLTDVCHQIANGRTVRSPMEYEAVQRFAGPDIASTLRDLLARHAAHDELRGFLCRMIWIGRIQTLLPEARHTAFDDTASRYTRLAALRALVALGSQQDIEDAWSRTISDARPIDRDFLAELLSRPPTNQPDVAWLMTVLRLTKAKRRFTVDRLSHALIGFMQGCSADDLIALLRGFAPLFEGSPAMERHGLATSQRFLWLMEATAHAIERLIRAHDARVLTEPVGRLLYRFKIVHQWEDEIRSVKHSFLALVPAWPELNRFLFWHDVRESRIHFERDMDRRLTNHWPAAHGAYWRFADSDFNYLCHCLVDATLTVDDRLVALSAAFTLYVECGRPRAWRQTLKRVCALDDELSAQLGHLLRPPRQADAMQAQRRRWQRQAAARQRIEAEQHAKSRTFILQNIDALRDPQLPDPAAVSRAQWYLRQQSRDQDKNSTRWTGGSWDNLVPVFGHDAARAYRDGVVAYWRRYRPLLRSEGAAANSTPLGVLFGLTGLEIEANETAAWADRLAPADAELACRYATHELNGFPLWFPKLFLAHRERVAQCLLDEMTWELSRDEAGSEMHYLLDDVCAGGEWLWSAIAPQLASAIACRRLAHPSTLGKVIAILVGSDLPDQVLADMAVHHAMSAPDPLLAARWYAIWVSVAPEAAIPALTAFLGTLPQRRDQIACAMAFATQLLGGRSAGTPHMRQAFVTADHLKVLYLLMLQYIRIQEDIDRANGGVYSPGMRDDAQDARNGLLELLNKLPGKAAFHALETVAANCDDVVHRSWIHHLIRRKAEQDADFTPWSALQVREFEEALERTPRNHRELADLVEHRLLDLKDDLEDGDSSIAALLQRVEHETEMRNYVGHTFRQLAHGRYVVPQEEELADAKRPDLRFHGVGFDAPVPIELKLADNWTGPALFERFENQLGGDYLRDTRSARGFFVLLYLGKKTSWDLPNGTGRADFAQLVDALNAYWTALSPRYPHVERIVVIGIDLTQRFR